MSYLPPAIPESLPPLILSGLPHRKVSMEASIMIEHPVNGAQEWKYEVEIPEYGQLSLLDLAIALMEDKNAPPGYWRPRLDEIWIDESISSGEALTNDNIATIFSKYVHQAEIGDTLYFNTVFDPPGYNTLRRFASLRKAGVQVEETATIRASSSNFDPAPPVLRGRGTPGSVALDVQLSEITFIGPSRDDIEENGDGFGQNDSSEGRNGRVVLNQGWGGTSSSGGGRRPDSNKKVRRLGRSGRGRGASTRGRSGVPV